MAFTYERTWAFSIDNPYTPSTALDESRYGLWAVKAMLLGQMGGLVSGLWTIDSSCDSVTAGVAGDGIDRWGGAVYTLHLPAGAVIGAVSGSVWPYTTATFTGVSLNPFVTSAYPQNGTSFVLIFNEEVDEASAIDLTHYSLVPSIGILNVAKVNATTYVMTTGQQTPGQSYTLTITGVIDKAKNPI